MSFSLAFLTCNLSDAVREGVKLLATAANVCISSSIRTDVIALTRV
jgi:hypothetical protein